MNINEKFEMCKTLFNDFNKHTLLSALFNNYLYTYDKIKSLRYEFKTFSSSIIENFTIILMGSFGRLESSKLSDLDYCIVYERNIEPSKKEEIRNFVESKIKEILDKKTSCFSDKAYEDIISNIGGFNDKSKDFTSRILILLESIPLNNENLYWKVVGNLCKIYLEEYLREQKYPLFLTNEIIRFWRTMCIDYRWKKMETEKTWGDRNIKLRFSRKLLCFSSILLLILLNKNFIDFRDFSNYVHCPPSIKLMTIYNLISSNGLTNDDEKILKIIEKILLGYNEFLENISNKDIRNSLKEMDFENRDSNHYYNDLKAKAKDFHTNLINLIENLDIEILKKFLIF